jgi:hypothetical protein
MRLPNFLVIGAMKCGTTTLYNDLQCSGDIFLPEKELNFLSSTQADRADAAAEYARHFRNARPDQICGDVSTTYAMLPDLAGVAERARRLLGEDTKVIYVVREPVSRAISHHYHMSCHQGAGRMDRDVDRSLREHASIVNFSRYAMQLEPWQRAFGDEAIKVVVFEEFVRDRETKLESIRQFLKLAEQQESTDISAIHNQSEGKRVLNRFWHGVYESRLYQHYLRPMIPPTWKPQLSELLLPVAPPRPAAPSIETVRYILDRTRDDVSRLGAFMGRRLPWDEAKVIHEFQRAVTTKAA